MPPMQGSKFRCCLARPFSSLKSTCLARPKFCSYWALIQAAELQQQPSGKELRLRNTLCPTANAPCHQRLTKNSAVVGTFIAQEGDDNRRIIIHRDDTPPVLFRNASPHPRVNAICEHPGNNPSMVDFRQSHLHIRLNQAQDPTVQVELRALGVATSRTRCPFKSVRNQLHFRVRGAAYLWEVEPCRVLIGKGRPARNEE